MKFKLEFSTFFFFNHDKVSRYISSEPVPLLWKCLHPGVQNYRGKKIHQMGFQFKMQILFEELHKGIHTSASDKWRKIYPSKLIVVY